jgi:glucose-6-phosphate dehydrogenase assembly protein OpcA
MAQSMRLGDLSWTRLTPWRESLFQVFENPRNAARLPEIAHVEIGYGGTSAPSQARYMAAWLNDCLRRAGARPELAFRADDVAETGEVAAVDLSGGSFRVRLERLRETLRTTVGEVSQCMSFPSLADHVLMNQDLDITGADPVFESTLAAATTLSL